MELKSTLLERLKALQTQKQQADNMATIGTRETQRLGGAIDELTGLINHLTQKEQSENAAKEAEKQAKVPAKKTAKAVPKKSVVASAVAQPAK